MAAAVSVLLAAADPPPKLVVLMVVDQMRADYIDRFHDDWSSGLRRLVDSGARFTEAAYPYLTTVTCAGHATISTGAYPHVHGIFANTWFDREHNVIIPCTGDPSAKAVPYGKPATSQTGPGNLMVRSFADEMRRNGSHVVTLALKARSAIMLAGHGGDAVTWISESLDGWETSTSYTSHPIPEVKAYVDAHRLDADFEKSWTRLLPAERYHDPDAGIGEDPSGGWSSLFPHVLKGLSPTPDVSYYDHWQHSPYADAYVARMAAALVESMHLGKHAKTDFLGVSFSSPDLVGHSFGPHSQEIQDMYAHLDRTIGGLLDALDRSVGRDAYVLALSADHGVTDIPEQIKLTGADAGRIDPAALLRTAQATVQTTLGPGNYVSRLNGNEIYFEPGMYQRVASHADLLRDVVASIAREPGIARVFTSDELKVSSASNDPQLRAAALSYVPGRSGDLVLSPKNGWMMSVAGTTHGSATPNDQRVPIVLYGRGIKSGAYDRVVSPADIAPTLAAIVGVALPKAEGHPLSEALR